MGAGLSGLTAAYRLARAGVDVLVLEARARVGGRAWRLEAGGLPFDAGCEALDEAHGRLLALAGEVGVPARAGEPWLGGVEPDLEGEELALLRAFDEELEALARRMDPEHPEETERAEELDRTSLAEWLRGRGASPRVLDAAETWHCVASASVALAETSLLAQAAKAAAGAAPNGLRLRLAGGPSALAERLADALTGRIRLEAEVVALEQEGNSVAVTLADGRREQGARAVVALPLTVQSGIGFRPPLPPHRRLALARARYGDVVKAGLAYETVAPREGRMLTGDGLVYEPEPGVPLLAVFAGAGPARRLAALTAPERERELGRLAGGSARGVAAVAWSCERFTCGSYLIFGPGDLTEWGRRLAEPHGRLHFAGSEASALPSYMEGAVRAGERAAGEALAAK